MTDSFFVTLQNRGLIQIEGEDRFEFLQNIVTNDVTLLETQPSIYACLLTPQGKFLHDFFILSGPDVLLLDCEGGERAQDLYERLNKYRLRSKVQISVEENHPVYAVFGNKTGIADPRHTDMGYRTFEKPNDMAERDFKEWDKKRIELCIADGSRDLEIEKSTLLEYRIDEFNGISFSKGCYVGQEVTARMKHRGLLKKKTYAITGDNLPEADTVIVAEDKNIGMIRSHCENVAIALLKTENLKAIKLNNFSVLSK